MKRFLKIFAVIALIITFTTTFNSSHIYVTVDNLAVVVAMGIDVSDTNRIRVSFQFTNPAAVSDTGSTEKSNTILNTIDAASVSAAINLMNAYMGKEITLSHCKLVVFSEEIAQKGIEEEIYSLMNDIQVRPSTNIIISKCEANYYIKNIKSLFEPLITQYYENFASSSNSTGYTANATLGDFFDQMICDYCEPYAILGGINTADHPNSSSTAHQDTTTSQFDSSPLSGAITAENIGLAVFRNGTLVGELNAVETLSFLIITNEVRGFLISVPDPKKEHGYLDLYLTPSSKSSISVSLVNGSPYVKIHAKFIAQIQSMSSNSDYLNPEVLEEVSDSANRYLSSVLSDFLYKTSKNLQSDISGIGKHCKSQFLTTKEFENYNWIHNYSDSFFDVTVDANVKSGSLISSS